MEHVDRAKDEDEDAIEALFEELGLDAYAQAPRTSGDGHVHEHTGALEEADGRYDDDPIDRALADMEHKNDDDAPNLNDDEALERQMEEVLALEPQPTLVPDSLSKQTRVSLRTPRPINLYFRVADNTCAAIRVDGQSSERALKGLEACIEEHCLPEHLAEVLKAALWKKLGQTPRWSDSLEDTTSGALSRWQSFYTNMRHEREQQSRQRSQGALPWFRNDCTEPVFVFRRAMKAALQDETIARKVCELDAKCSADLQELQRETSTAREKLTMVQQHELRFMQESLGGDHGISKADIDKLCASHRLALEQIDNAHRQQYTHSYEDWAQKYRRLVLSLVGNQEDAPRTADEIEHSTTPQRSRPAYDVRDDLDPNVVRDARRMGLGALRPDGARASLSSHGRGRPSEGLLSAAMGNLAMGGWVGQLLPEELLLRDLSLDASASTSRVRQRLDERLSTYVDAIEVYLGAQLKVLMHLRLETVVGGALWALSHAAPAVSKLADFCAWRKSRLERFFPAQEPSSFVGLALPASQASRIERAVRHTADLFGSYLDQPEGTPPDHPTADVTSSLHSTLGLDVVCVLQATHEDRSVALRAAIEHASVVGITNLAIPLRDWILGDELQAEDDEAARGKFTRTRLGKKDVEQLVRVVRATLMSLAHRNITGGLREVTLLLKSSSTGPITQADAEAWQQVREQDRVIVGKARALVASAFEVA